MTPTLTPVDSDFARIVAGLNRRRFLGAGALAGAGLLLTACGGPSEGSAPAGAVRTVQTVLGPVEVPAHPQRVVSADYYTGSAIVDAGFDPVGVPVDFDSPDGVPEPYASALRRPAKVGRWYEPNAEAIAALDPDLVVMTDRLAEVEPQLFDRIRALAPTVVYPEKGRFAWKERARGVADALNRQEDVRRLERRYDERIERFRTENADVLDAVRVVYTTYFPEDGFSLYPPTLYQTTVIGEAGFRFTDRATALGNVNEWYPKEQLELLDEADVIITNAGKGPIDAALGGDSLFERLRPVRTGQVYSIDYEGVSSFGWALAFLEQFQPIVEGIRRRM